MAIDVTIEPGKTLKRLAHELTERTERLERLTKWLDGHGPLPDCAEAYKFAYHRLQKKARLNLAPIVVQAVKERMTPVGFLVGDSAEADKEAWRIWSTNEMKRQASEVHGDMLGLVWGYVIVGEADQTGVPVITREDPRQCITQHDPLRHSRVTAALKMYTDEVAGRDYCYLYLPGAVVVASRTHSDSQRSDEIPTYDWDSDFGDNGVYQLSVPGIVPVVCFENAGAISGRPTAEFETHIETLQRINETILHRLVITTMQAFKQRAVMGKLPETKDAEDPDNPGETIEMPMVEKDYKEMFLPGAGKMWLTNAPAEGEDAIKFWESQATDVTQLLTAVTDDLKIFAAETATPLSMLMPDGQNQSAEGASTMKEALVTKVVDRQALAGYGWNTVMRLAFAFAGKGQVNVETQWMPAELVSLSEKADAYSKLADLPLATKLRMVMQLSEDQIARIETEVLGDIINSALGAPPAGASSGV